MVEHLESVALKEHVEAEPEALNVIAQKADGGMRDALSIFDQVVSFTNGHITYKSVIDNLNVLDYEYYFRLTDCFLENKVTECMLLFNDVLKKGFDGNHFITGLSSHLRDLLVSRDPATLPLLEVGASIRERYQAQAQKCTPQFLYKAMKLCNDCDLNYRLSKNKRLLVELTLIQVAQLTAEAEEPGQGRSPKQTLSPVFNQATAQAAQPATPKPQPAAGNYAAQPAGNYASTLQQPNASYRPAEPVQPATSAPSPQASAPGAGPNACQSAAENIGGKEDSGHESRKHGYFHPAVAGTTNRKSRSCMHRLRLPSRRQMPTGKIISLMKKTSTTTGVNLPPAFRKKKQPTQAA